jgi:hypothetical protein
MTAKIRFGAPRRGSSGLLFTTATRPAQLLVLDPRQLQQAEPLMWHIPTAIARAAAEVLARPSADPGTEGRDAS